MSCRRCLFALALVWLVSLRAEPLVILVSIDGCRWDYPEKHDAPWLQTFAREAARLERLTPSYPTKTFPNHYTLVTGLRPASHGIIQNRFYDPTFEAWFGIGAHPAAREGRWWGGEPIWLTAQRQGLRAACMFWPGAEADIQGRRPDRWLRYNGAMTDEARVAQVLAWTALPATERPHVITLYFEAVDTAGHRHGPDAPETRAALHRIDTALAELQRGLEAQGLWPATHLIVTSDHGMTPLVPDGEAVLDDLIDLDTVEVVFAGAIGGLQVKTGSAEDLVNELNRDPRVTAYTRQAMPERFHFQNNPRIPDIVVVPRLGHQISTRSWLERRTTRDGGDHGFDYAEPDMGALFLARGPRIQSGLTLPPEENVHVYALLCALLGVEPAAGDGDDRLVRAMLRPEEN